MDKIELGTVVAERRLELVCDGGQEVPCLVKVGKPVSDENGDWICPYEVEAGQHISRFRIYGGDSLQALILTLKTLDMEVSQMAKKHGAKVFFFGEPLDSIFNP